jgi:hypothetical protein
MRIFPHNLFALFAVIALLVIFRAFFFILSSFLGFDLFVVVLRRPLGLASSHLLLLLLLLLLLQIMATVATIFFDFVAAQDLLFFKLNYRRHV